MKIWKNFKTKSDFLPMSRQRNCFKVCHHCKKYWREIKTDFVHMVWDKKNENKFICDNCKNENQNGSS